MWRRPRLKEKVFYPGIKIHNNGSNVSHLLYADDALFIREWSRSNLKNLARILRCFHVTSGLKVNFHKSQVFSINVQREKVSREDNILGCGAGSLPFKYLGVLVGANMNLTRNWKPIMDRFKSNYPLGNHGHCLLAGRSLSSKLSLAASQHIFSRYSRPQWVY